MIEGFAPLPGSGNEDLQLRFHGSLTDVLLEPPGADGALGNLVLAL
jgi:hypothetical protein